MTPSALVRNVAQPGDSEPPPPDYPGPPDLTPSAWCRKEAAHVVLHENPPGHYLARPVKEVEAESVAFVVAAAHGMPTDGYTFPYVAGWAGGENPAKAVHATQARVGQAARLIIEASPAPHEAGGKAPGAAAAVEAARQARFDRSPVIEPVGAGVGV